MGGVFTKLPVGVIFFSMWSDLGDILIEKEVSYADVVAGMWSRLSS